ncbi:MAG: cardiolipin synthase, partial [Thermoplasmata archaeon]
SEMSFLSNTVEKLTDIPRMNGNDVKLLIDGDATFDSIIAGIDAAKEYILFQFFIIHDDGLGRRIKDHLIARAEEGVKIYVLYDEVGSHDLSQSYQDDLRAVGVEIHPFNTRKGSGNRFQLNFRNHRKIVIIDGKVAWVGGHNVGDEYLGLDPKFGHWRDTHIRVEGPAAAALQISFLEDWFWTTDNYKLNLTWKPTPSATGNIPINMLPSSPADELETATLMFLHAINSAKERIWITSPYFVPDDAIISALQLAGLRGVDVRILIPDKPDHIPVYLAAYTYFEEASLTGVRFFRYLDGFLHQKVMLIDDTISTVGTANFDNRSFRLNFEITSIVIDTDFNTEIEKMLLNDFERSREMTKSDWEDKSYFFKLACRIARLTSPIQ